MQRAAARGVQVVALTDHDTVDGLAEAEAEAGRLGVRLVPGVEVSVTWNGRTLHVLGLGVDSRDPALNAGLERIRAGRLQRARAIAARLETAGLRGSLEAALAAASNPDMISRTHFARHMVVAGFCKDMKSAFRRYLGEGRPAYVRHAWASLPEAVDWIKVAGGVPVLAHPGRYGLRRARLHDLFCEFRALGGKAVEVISGSHSVEQTRLAAALSVECGLLASAGSDFHGPEESWRDIGQIDPLPIGCVPLWQDARLAGLQ